MVKVIMIRIAKMRKIMPLNLPGNAVISSKYTRGLRKAKVPKSGNPV